MFSNIVTAAKGLFGRSSSEPSLPNEENPKPAVQESSPQGNMVTATRRRKFQVPDSEAGDSSTVVSPGNAESESSVLNGKRKIESSEPDPEVEEQSTKRRRKKKGDTNGVKVTDNKMSGIGNGQRMVAVEIDNSATNSAAGSFVNGDLDTNVDALEETAKPSGKSAHVRFGSEEPVPETQGDEEPATETVQDGVENGPEESDDDEAPEALDNTAQLLKMKDAARKEELAKQRLEQQKKEKRRERDQLLKSQAVGRVDNNNIKTPKLSLLKDNVYAKPDELRSESSATLQGSTKAPLRALPALLPDDILNAEPTIRPPTPPTEDEESTRKISKKKQFLETVERRPRDVKIGGGSTAIRVFDSGSSSSGNSNAGMTALPPKSNKDSRRVRESWMAGKGKPASGSNLRRTTGSSGFVRR